MIAEYNRTLFSLLDDKTDRMVTVRAHPLLIPTKENKYHEQLYDLPPPPEEVKCLGIPSDTIGAVGSPGIPGAIGIMGAVGATGATGATGWRGAAAPASSD